MKTSLQYNTKFTPPPPLKNGVLIPYEENYPITGLYDAFKYKVKFWHLNWTDDDKVIGNTDINNLIKAKGFTLVTINDFVKKYGKVTFFMSMESLKNAYSRSVGISFRGDL